MTMQAKEGGKSKFKQATKIYNHFKYAQRAF